jgi:hypothetical protein
MPTPTIPAGNLYMNATLYTGNGSTQTITNGVAGQSFQPDFAWSKNRSNARSHALVNSVAGATLQLQSNTTAAEFTGGFASLNSNGFSVNNVFNENNTSETYVAWQWKGGGTAVTNTSGTISAQVSANTTSGFSVVTYSITSASATISTFGHGLGVAPSMVILKVRNSVDDWTVYHSSITTPNSNWLTLNSTAAAGGATSTFSSSSTTFGVRETRLVAASGSGTVVAYCWTPIAGYSAFGSYTGNGSSDGTFVYTGFRPKYIMIKMYSGSNSWALYDTTRQTYNGAVALLLAEAADTEYTTTYLVDILSNGFKLRATNGIINASGSTYIYACFAENPFKYANAR